MENDDKRWENLGGKKQHGLGSLDGKQCMSAMWPEMGSRRSSLHAAESGVRTRHKSTCKGGKTRDTHECGRQAGTLRRKLLSNPNVRGANLQHPPTHWRGATVPGGIHKGRCPTKAVVRRIGRRCGSPTGGRRTNTAARGEPRATPKREDAPPGAPSGRWRRGAARETHMHVVRHGTGAERVRRV